MSECILLVDDDALIKASVALLLERPGRTIVTCSDVESAELALDRYPVTHLVTDVQFSGAFGFEGLHFLARVRGRQPGCRIILMTGFASDALREEALRNGAAAVLAKPFGSEEIESALRSRASRTEEAPNLVRVLSIDEILRERELRAVFQPIVPLDREEQPFAFEALTRVRDGWAAGGAAELFAYASRCSRLGDLNLTALGCAMSEAHLLPREAMLFVNVDPTVLETPSFAQRFRRAAGGAGLPLERVVVEITERCGFSDERGAAGVFDELRDAGVRFALDDVGSAYSHLPLISRIQPSFIKISNVFGTGSERDETKRRIVRNVLALARDFGCRTVLEGVETRDTANAAADLGIDLAQGYLFGYPQPAAVWSGEPRRACA